MAALTSVVLGLVPVLRTTAANGQIVYLKPLDVIGELAIAPPNGNARTPMLRGGRPYVASAGDSGN